MSVYKLETWLNKGFSHDEALYQIKIRRSTNVEYYMHKFNVPFDEAQIMLKNRQKRSADICGSRPKKERLKTNKKCKEYWLDKGYSLDEAIEIVSKSQVTFSKELCIEKYGEIEGLARWNKRQTDWQNTLSNKSDEEISAINLKKNNMKLKTWVKQHGDDGRNRYKQFLIEKGCDVFDSLHELENLIISKMTPFDTYLPIDNFINKYIKNYYWELVEKPKCMHTWIKSFVTFVETKDVIFKPYSFYNMYAENGKLLKSSNEIYFYMILTRDYNLKIDQDFKINSYYPNSKLMYDFYLTDQNLYIELCGLMNDSSYLQNVLFKQNTYGSILLTNQKEYKPFLESALCKI